MLRVRHRIPDPLPRRNGPLSTQTGLEPAASGWESRAAGLVLAGGRSTRIGTDKAQLQLHGQPLAALALATLRQSGLSAAFAGGNPSLSRLAPIIEDPLALGPLSGICSALASTKSDLSLFLPVDLPLLPPLLLTCLLRHTVITHAPITVTSVSGFPQTFPSVIHRSALPTLERELEARRLGCFSAFQAAAAALATPLSVLPVEYLLQAGQIAHPASLPAAWWYLNINTPADLARAQLRSQSLFA